MKYPLLLVVPTETKFGENPEAMRAAARKKLRKSISTREEETTVGTMDYNLPPCDLELGCGGGSDGGVSAGGQPLPSGLTSQCFVSPYSAGDSDGDGILQSCEYELAYGFRPYLYLDAGDDDPRREPYWAVKRGSNPGTVRILYAMSYYMDGGAAEGSILPNSYDHWGDSEFISLDVGYGSGKWYLNSAFLSAHWDTPSDASETVGHDQLQYPSGVIRTRPIIWVAEDKHANYKGSNACDRGAFWTDNCDFPLFARGDFLFEVEVGSAFNLGNWNHRVETCPTSRYNNSFWMNTAPYWSFPLTSRSGQECYWSGEKFAGWQSGQTDIAGIYLDVFSSFLYE